MATYANAVHPLVKVVDGLVLGGYFGSGVPLEVGQAVLNPADRQSRDLILGSGRHLLRDDLDVPVMVVNSESEAISYFGARQPDSEGFRFWEVAGASHAAVPEIRSMAQRSQRDMAFTYMAPDGLNPVSPIPVVDAAFIRMRSWTTDGNAPPRQPRIEIAGDPPEVLRDDDGIARGGLRLPQVVAPIGSTLFSPEEMLGVYRPFSKEDLLRRYGDRARFLAKFEGAVTAAVSTGVLRPHDGRMLVAEAESGWDEAVGDGGKPA